MKAKNLSSFGLVFSPHSVHHHENRNYPCALHCIIGGGVFALWGCEKVAPNEPSPKAAQADQTLAPAKATQTLSPAQAAWLKFVDLVEQGKLVDPSGQYVAKGTMAAVDAAGKRISRPKFDAATPAFARHYVLSKKGEITALSVPGVGGTANKFDNPCADCPVPGPTTTVTSTFVTSVGQGGPGPIHDLKIAYNDDSKVALQNAGYTFINSDLNKGCGGAYIYFYFNRNALTVLNGPEYSQNKPYSGPNDILRYFQTNTNGGRFGPVVPSFRFFYMWTPIGTTGANGYNGGYTQPDLNGGAGGEYIYSYQSKDPTLINSADITEVGVLSGNSDTIQPPAGWTKYGNDLNQGAGGDYIYFCYR